MPRGVFERIKYPVYWEQGKHEEIFVTGRQKNKLPPLEILNWLFRYSEESGKLYRIRGSSGKLWEPEKEISTVNDTTGYLIVSIRDSNGLRKMFQVHHIIYFMVSGIEPLSIVDHMDGDKLNNRFSNLRLTNDSGNQRNKRMSRNNTSGFTGVSWSKENKRWIAMVSGNDGKQKNLGLFDDIEVAAAAVSTFRNNPELGYTVRHGL